MKFLKNTWYLAAYTKELESDQAKIARTIAEEPILLYRKSDGELAAVSNICPHRFAALDSGELKEDTIACPYHGLVFDSKGKCVHNPHSDVIPKTAVLKTYPTHEEYGYIWVWTGDQKPDHKAVPDMSEFVSTEMAQFVTSYFKADYRYDILVDNLLDLSHANYLHVGSFSAGIPERATTDVEKEGNTVTIERREWSMPIPGFVKHLFPDADLMNQRTRIKWHPSQMIHFLNGMVPEDAEVADSDMRMRFYHVATPQDENNTHYFLGVTRFGPGLGQRMESKIRQWQSFKCL